MRRRSFLVLLLFPAIIILWTLGWSLFCIGDNKRAKDAPTKNRKP